MDNVKGPKIKGFQISYYGSQILRLSKYGVQMPTGGFYNLFEIIYGGAGGRPVIVAIALNYLIGDKSLIYLFVSIKLFLLKHM